LIKNDPNLLLDKQLVHHDNVPSHMALSVKEILQETNTSVGTFPLLM
jgi:hypothetical protein